jgi:hypothetical protein
MVENEHNANLLYFEYKPKRINKYKSNNLKRKKNIILQQVQYQEYLQQMDMYQINRKQNYVEDLLPNYQDLYSLLPNIKTLKVIT